jgi:hypothetical protein
LCQLAAAGGQEARSSRLLRAQDSAIGISVCQYYPLTTYWGIVQLNYNTNDNSESQSSKKGDEKMSQNSLLAVALLVGVPVMFIWRQLLKLVAVLAVVVFCLGVYGLYHVAQHMHL